MGRSQPVDLPCQTHDPDLWFADDPAQLGQAVAFCMACPVREACFAGALQRREPAGVWGGRIFDDGLVVSHKRRPGRPRKGSTAPTRYVLPPPAEPIAGAPDISLSSASAAS